VIFDSFVVLLQELGRPIFLRIFWTFSNDIVWGGVYLLTLCDFSVSFSIDDYLHSEMSFLVCRTPSIISTSLSSAPKVSLVFLCLDHNLK